MTDNQPNDSFESFEKAMQDAQKKKYILKLYISGNTAKSARAILNLKKVCSEYLENQYELEVIDIYQQPSLAIKDQILATPTLVKSLPLPLRKIIGDLTKTERILVGLDLVDIHDK